MSKVTLISPTTKQEVMKLQVAAYCRVSSSSADQLNSYARQIKVYTDIIKRHHDWELVEIFADEGISGVEAAKRPEFLRMINACEHGQINLIITKSVSRFARNVKETLEYVRKLKLLGVAVQFEKEGINTQSLGDEMLIIRYENAFCVGETWHTLEGGFWGHPKMLAVSKPSRDVIIESRLYMPESYTDEKNTAVANFHTKIFDLNIFCEDIFGDG